MMHIAMPRLKNVGCGGDGIRELHVLLDQRSRNRTLRESAEEQRFIERARVVNKFGRGTPVAYKACPLIKIGEVVAGPTLRSPANALVRLDSSQESRMLLVSDIDVWVDPEGE